MTSTTRGVALLLLPLLSVAAVYCLWIVASNNGLFKQISDLAQQKQPFFPGSESPLVLKYTGVAAVDRQLTTLVAFFGPVFQGGNEPLNLFSLFGFGQFGAAWTLLLMESFRKGNQGKAVSLYFAPKPLAFGAVTKLWIALVFTASSFKTYLSLSARRYISSSIF
jgi:hypothetical protein